MDKTLFDAVIELRIRVSNAQSHLTNTPLEDEVRQQLSERIGTRFNHGTVDLQINKLQIENERPVPAKSMGATR